MGLLIPLRDLALPEDIPVGEIVTELLGITKYEPPIDSAYWGNSEQAADPGVAPVFDVEGLRMFPDAFKGKRVIVTEKIHGTNFRAVFKDGQLHVGSHRTWLKKSPNVWWNVVQNYKLEEKFVDTGLVFYGEIYGPKIQDLTYGVKTPQIIFYDVMRAESGQFLAQDEARYEVERLELPFVPELYEGWWDDQVKMLAEGESLLAVANGVNLQIREGIVIRPVIEEFSPELGGRLILKLCGEAYYTRKEKS
jgi:RNA ligase (TIGR02306 family)